MFWFSLLSYVFSKRSETRIYKFIKMRLNTINYHKSKLTQIKVYIKQQINQHISP